jgi:mRNA-degrading endonuclease RelE of RelBE toxin-antitoxin system
MFAIELTDSAQDDLRFFRRFDQTILMDAIDGQLQHQPATETRHRKPLEPNDLGQWELRVGKFRVFYDVETTESVVAVKAIGLKEHNKLFIRGKEYKL